MKFVVTGDTRTPRPQLYADAIRARLRFGASSGD